MNKYLPIADMFSLAVEIKYNTKYFDHCIEMYDKSCKPEHVILLSTNYLVFEKICKLDN